MSQPDDACPTCFGSGNDPTMRSPYPMRKIRYKPCPDCNGTGQQPKPRARSARHKSKAVAARRKRAVSQSGLFVVLDVVHIARLERFRYPRERRL
jgi:DnaJ-class molecular chaperone